MKTIITAAAFVLVSAGLGVGQARAQEITEAKIPFSFIVQGRHFPAGRYELTRENDVLCIRGIDHPTGAFAMTNPAGGSDPAGNDSALVFTKFENDYELSQIWDSNREGFDVAGHSAPKSHDRAAAMIAPTVVLTYGLQANWK